MLAAKLNKAPDDRSGGDFSCVDENIWDALIGSATLVHSKATPTLLRVQYDMIDDTSETTSVSRGSTKAPC